MKSCGIYQIVNRVTGGLYIGQTTHLRKRERQHFYHLRREEHQNPHLQSAYDKYGRECFAFEVLLYCEQFELTHYEQAFVDRLNPVYNVYRECVDSPKGIPCTEKSKRRTSELHKGIPLSKEHRRKISESLKGRVFTKEHRKKLSDGQRKRLPPTDETKKKLTEAGRKRRLSEESRKKMSNSLKGRVFSSEAKKKNAAAHRGKTPSMETRRKISESVKRTKTSQKKQLWGKMVG